MKINIGDNLAIVLVILTFTGCVMHCERQVTKVACYKHATDKSICK